MADILRGQSSSWANVGMVGVQGSLSGNEVMRGVCPSSVCEAGCCDLYLLFESSVRALLLLKHSSTT